jgi:hypothetical protein
VCKFKKNTILVVACLTAVMLSEHAYSEEIAPFRITGVDGEVYGRYFTDDYRSKTNGVETSSREGTTTEEGLDFTVHSYLYHPNLFRLDFGGGPVFVQHDYKSNIEDNSDDDEYVNLHARAHILEKKPYPLMLYYDKHTSTTPYAVQDRMLLKSENYGLNFRLQKPLLPALVVFDLSHFEVDGKNLQRVTDETTDRASVRASSDLGANGDGTIGYSWTQNKSKSGALAEDNTDSITETKRTTHLLDARTEHLFGLDEWIRFRNNFTYKKQTNLPDLKEYRYSPSLYLTHSKSLNSYYRLNFLDRTNYLDLEGEEIEIDTTSRAFDTGLTHLSIDDRLETDVNLHWDKYKTEGLDQTYYLAGVNLSYLQPYAGFDVRYTGGWSYDYTDRVGDDVSVIAETHTININTISFDLDNFNVIESSIVVKNSNGIPYINGIDYEVITIGEITKIRWIGDFDPTDPNDADLSTDVFVDYIYASGGTAAFSGFRQLYRIDLMRGKYLRLFAKYQSLDRNLESGDPTIPLNSKETKTVGMRVDYPLVNDWTLGGNAEHQRHDADVGSYRSNTGGVYLQIPKVLKGNIRLFADRLLVDNLESQEDVDLIRYGVRYNSRPWFRTTLSADLVDENDTGGTRERSNTRASVRLNWAYRQLNLSSEYRYFTDQLGESDRKRSSFNLILTRSF